MKPISHRLTLVYIYGLIELGPRGFIEGYIPRALILYHLSPLMALSIYRYIIHFLEDRHRPYRNILIHIIYAHYKACEDYPCEPPKLSANIKCTIFSIL
jgi:hypothetical protein